jgi:hypothetical protein
VKGHATVGAAARSKRPNIARVAKNGAVLKITANYSEKRFKRQSMISESFSFSSTPAEKRGEANLVHAIITE